MTDVELVLGRPIRDIPTDWPLEQLQRERILVTGAKGSIGSALVPMLEDAVCTVAATDKDTLDVTRLADCFAAADQFSPTLVFHLAGAKLAPNGEESPLDTSRVNIDGTAHVLRAFPLAKVVLASTCKACDPETVYGASKLIAERMVLNAGGTIARYYNVVETGGNVFRLWETLPGTVPVTDCTRFFISLSEALALTVWAAVLPSGRYTVNPGGSRKMFAVARALGRHYDFIPRRRGDRMDEPLKAKAENLYKAGKGIERIVGPHDPVRAEAVAA